LTSSYAAPIRPGPRWRVLSQLNSDAQNEKVDGTLSHVSSPLLCFAHLREIYEEALKKSQSPLRHRKTIKKAAENFPETPFYKTEDLLTQMGTGEALITTLDEKGIPTPLAHTMLCPPRSRMDVLSEVEIDSLITKSKLVNKYNRVVDNESAYEILNEKLDDAVEKSMAKPQKNEAKEESIFDSPAMKQAQRTAASIITRSLLGALGLGGSSKRRKNSWF